MKLLVTGGSGYLGAGILKRAPRDWEIAATYRTHPLASAHVAAVCLDVRDANGVERLVAEFRPDVIIHTAALMSGDAMIAANGDGSRHVARAAARNHARLIHLSSDVIFDGEHAPYDESAPPAPVSPYGLSKALAESAVGAECPGVVVVRTSLIYGFDPLDPRTRQTLAGDMPLLFTDEYRCPIFLDDAADALLELAASDYRGVLDVAGDQRLSRYEFGARLVDAFHTPRRFTPAPSPTGPVRRPRDCTLDVSRARRVLRTRLRGVDQVLNEQTRLAFEP